MEQLKHECGVALIRLLKPLEYYKQKYGTSVWGLNKLYLLMEKQHNRGQEGAGVCITRLDSAPGEEYMFRVRALGSDAISKIFGELHNNPEARGQLMMGHLRYSTTGRSGISYVHPFLRRNNWQAKNLALCGNFNMTNVEDIFDEITAIGQHPRILGDTYIILEQMGHRLDRECERLYQIAEGELGLKGKEITRYIDDNVDMFNVLSKTSKIWDGGYVICGTNGSGEMIAMRDPWGIRPAFWYRNDEVFVLASERPVIQTVFDLETEDINELQPGEAVNITRHGEMRLKQIIRPHKVTPCSFERIYFSRGSDRDIYQERKKLGFTLTQPILNALDGDIVNTVFAYIPNTAEVAFYGMLDGMKQELNRRNVAEIQALGHNPSDEELSRILNRFVRSEKVAIKDIKLRTFITEEAGRNDLSAHVYDITYGSVRAGVDNLVIIDDSIVRGTTLRESIIRILDRLHPKQIIIVSSAPQVRYPDYYGIDMSRLEEFIAFRAAIALLRDRGMQCVIDEVYALCKTAHLRPLDNPVRKIYEPFTDEEISAKMVEMLRPDNVSTPIKLVFQTIDGLQRTCPDHNGDWYFSGRYPTPGGLKLLNRAFVRYYEHTFIAR